MPFNLLLLPLLGGYIFARRCNITRYNALRFENHRLIFLAAEFGVFFLLTASIITATLHWLSGKFQFLFIAGKLWTAISPFDYSGTALLAFLIGYVSPFFINLRYDKETQLNKAISEKGDPLEVLLKYAMMKTKPVLLTLRSGKVYVGFITVNFNPAYQVQSLKIMPILSGYRTPDKHTVTFNIDYSSLYKEFRNDNIEEGIMEAEDIGTVISVDEIRSVSIFNLKLYKKYFSSNHPKTNH